MLYNAIVNQIVNDERYYIFIDEIQMVDGFEEVVNGLRVDYNCDVYITGSNSKLLSKDINTKMRGRSIEIKVYPLSFAEFYDYSMQNNCDYSGWAEYLVNLISKN